MSEIPSGYRTTPQHAETDTADIDAACAEIGLPPYDPSNPDAAIGNILAFIHHEGQRCGLLPRDV